MVLFISLFFPFLVWAQASQQATVISEEAQVYQDADFDAPVIAVVKGGQVYSISATQKGPFFKIRVKPGLVGWIADNDVKASGKTAGGAAVAGKEAIKIEEKKELRLPPFLVTRYWGLTFDYLNYSEDTMGKERSAGMLFYGLKWNGFNTLFPGEAYVESNILFHAGAPKYYEDVTGKGAGGYIVNANFLLQTVKPWGKSFLGYYGLGPMVRYSHFDLQLPDSGGGGTTTSYVADDMALGLVINLGTAYRISTFSIRADAKYYWEKNKYYGFGLNFGWMF